MSDKQQFNIDELAEAIAGKIRPPVPLDQALWNIGDIAGYVRKSKNVVQQRMICLPGFPKPIRLPAMNPGKLEGSGHPLWNAKEVIDWVQSHKERIEGRPRKAG